MGVGVVATALRVAQTAGQGLGPLYQYLLHHHLYRAVVAHSTTVARLNVLTEAHLGELLRDVARPILIATKDAPATGVGVGVGVGTTTQVCTITYPSHCPTLPHLILSTLPYIL